MKSNTHHVLVTDQAILLIVVLGFPWPAVILNAKGFKNPRIDKAPQTIAST
jgi:hypothetical protein